MIEETKMPLIDMNVKQNDITIVYSISGSVPTTLLQWVVYWLKISPRE